MTSANLSISSYKNKQSESSLPVPVEVTPPAYLQFCNLSNFILLQPRNPVYLYLVTHPNSVLPPCHTFELSYLVTFKILQALNLLSSHLITHRNIKMFTLTHGFKVDATVQTKVINEDFGEYMAQDFLGANSQMTPHFPRPSLP